MTFLALIPSSFFHCRSTCCTRKSSIDRRQKKDKEKKKSSLIALISILVFLFAMSKNKMKGINLSRRTKMVMSQEDVSRMSQQGMRVIHPLNLSSLATLPFWVLFLESSVHCQSLSTEDVRIRRVKKKMRIKKLRLQPKKARREGVVSWAKNPYKEEEYKRILERQEKSRWGLKNKTENKMQ